MSQILIVTGDGGESYEALYAVHRFEESIRCTLKGHASEGERRWGWAPARVDRIRAMPGILSTGSTLGCPPRSQDGRPLGDARQPRENRASHRRPRSMATFLKATRPLSCFPARATCASAKRCCCTESCAMRV